MWHRCSRQRWSRQRWSMQRCDIRQHRSHNRMWQRCSRQISRHNRYRIRDEILIGDRNRFSICIYRVQCRAKVFQSQCHSLQHISILEHWNFTDFAQMRAHSLGPPDSVPRTLEPLPRRRNLSLSISDHLRQSALPTVHGFYHIRLEVPCDSVTTSHTWHLFVYGLV